MRCIFSSAPLRSLLLRNQTVRYGAAGPALGSGPPLAGGAHVPIHGAGARESSAAHAALKLLLLGVGGEVPFILAVVGTGAAAIGAR